MGYLFFPNVNPAISKNFKIFWKFQVVLVIPYFVIFAPLCSFFASLCNLQASPLCNYTAPLCNHKKLPHFVIICKINLGIFLYIFDSLAIFPRKSNHGEDDRHILNFRSLTVEKTQMPCGLLTFFYRHKYFA